MAGVRRSGMTDAILFISGTLASPRAAGFSIFPPESIRKG
jgi:hypothetical protein